MSSASDAGSTPGRRSTQGVLAVAMCIACLATSARVVGAQQCDTVTSRTTLGEFSGRQIRSLRIVTRAPEPFPGPASALARLHVRTRASTIRHHLLIASGEALDTLRVAESLRRLRRVRYLTDVQIEAADCGDGPIDLTVRTQDGWSKKPSVQMRSASSAFEFTERNVLGTGREASIAIRSDLGRVGVGATLRDPWFLGTRMALDLGTNSYRDGSERFASIGRFERSALEPWQFDAQFARSVRDPSRTTSDAAARARTGALVRRTRASVLGARRTRVSENAVTSLSLGAEYDAAELVASFDAALVGPATVRRAFAGIDLGMARRAIAYDTVTWILTGGAIVDVPMAFEGDVLLGFGQDRVSGSPAAHVDLWTGRIWRPSKSSLLVGDVWASGFRLPSAWSAGTLRSALTYYRGAPRGVWTARVTYEQLLNPDPDLRTSVFDDPTSRALPKSTRLAEAAASLSIERSLRLRRLTRSWALDGAAFAAISARWDPPNDPALPRLDEGLEVEQVHATAFGIGLRMAPRKGGRATARVDVGFPVLSSAGVRRRPFIAFSVSPSFDQGRRREGRRAR